MVSNSERNNSLPVMPEWVNWLQAGLTTLLVVLFVVILGKGRQQSANLRLLEQRVQGLENARALDRTTGLEQQLRSAVARLQVLERSAARVNALSAENSLLHRELRQLRAAAQARAAEPVTPPLPPLKTEPETP
ncbi:MAG: hypothetical protein ACKO7Z_07835 [Cyanobacteriota bacterium]